LAPFGQSPSPAFVFHKSIRLSNYKWLKKKLLEWEIVMGMKGTLMCEKHLSPSAL
jgi:hypothetical protein